MLPSPTGTAVVASNFNAANGTQTFTFSGIAIPTYIYNPNEIGFVAWVQNNTTKEVYQAGILLLFHFQIQVVYNLSPQQLIHAEQH